MDLVGDFDKRAISDALNFNDWYRFEHIKVEWTIPGEARPHRIKETYVYRARSTENMVKNSNIEVVPLLPRRMDELRYGTFGTDEYGVKHPLARGEISEEVLYRYLIQLWDELSKDSAGESYGPTVRESTASVYGWFKDVSRYHTTSFTLRKFNALRNIRDLLWEIVENSLLTDRSERIITRFANIMSELTDSFQPILFVQRSDRRTGKKDDNNETGKGHLGSQYPFRIVTIEYQASPKVTEGRRSFQRSGRKMRIMDVLPYPILNFISNHRFFIRILGAQKVAEGGRSFQRSGRKMRIMDVLPYPILNFFSIHRFFIRIHGAPMIRDLNMDRKFRTHFEINVPEGLSILKNGIRRSDDPDFSFQEEDQNIEVQGGTLLLRLGERPLRDIRDNELEREQLESEEGSPTSRTIFDVPCKESHNIFLMSWLPLFFSFLYGSTLLIWVPSLSDLISLFSLVMAGFIIPIGVGLSVMVIHQRELRKPVTSRFLVSINLATLFTIFAYDVVMVLTLMGVVLSTLCIAVAFYHYQ